ncbi:phosphatase PAP2 family protein [Azoarcus sp. DN11]|uniref:phosphatase PAP2 family protein n=1 Tax=Azoarcus sp. DN11 TaxID=356837 RepID=UPI000EAFB79B|nr:phosphatase PAP2 family protein [Azoarcus sp. DN11]AYH45686.1 phosphatase PAP2 family protein [Azoarcus sp. DN11]
MYELDAAATHAINSLAGASTAIDALMIWTSAIGVPILVLAVAGQWWVRNERAHTRHVLIATGFSFLAGLALNQFILLFAHRMRPYDAGVTHLLIAASPDYSFPSDHATASFAIPAALLLHGFRRRSLAFLAAALLIAFSRVYVGTHYLGDVLGGAATALVAAALVCRFHREGSRLDGLLTRIW